MLERFLQFPLVRWHGVGTDELGGVHLEGIGERSYSRRQTVVALFGLCKRFPVRLARLVQIAFLRVFPCFLDGLPHFHELGAHVELLPLWQACRRVDLGVLCRFRGRGLFLGVLRFFLCHSQLRHRRVPPTLRRDQVRPGGLQSLLVHFDEVLHGFHPFVEVNDAVMTGCDDTLQVHRLVMVEGRSTHVSFR